MGVILDFYAIHVPNYVTKLYVLLKLSQNKKDLNDVKYAPFLVSFSQLPAAKKSTENGAAVTSLRSFLFHDDFSQYAKNSYRYLTPVLKLK